MKDEDLKKYTSVRYRVRSLDEIIHPFSRERYELTADDYDSYVDLYENGMSPEEGHPLEFTGHSFDEEEKKKLERAVKNSVFLYLSELDCRIKRVVVKTGWFFVCLVLSSVLLYMSDKRTDEVVAQFLNVPFYFFGYRMLTYPVFDLVPLLKKKKKYLAFQAAGNWKETYNNFIDRYITEDGNLWISARVTDMEDIIRKSSRDFFLIITDKMACYLDKFMPFMGKKRKVKLEICGRIFSADEKKEIRSAFRNYYEIRRLNVMEDIRTNNRKVIIFSVFLAVFSIALYRNKNMDVALHELILMTFWFIADYLVEFCLLSARDLSGIKKKYAELKELQIVFKEK